MAVGKLGIVTEAFPLWPYWRERRDGKQVLFAVTLNTGLLAAESDLKDTFEALGANNEDRSRALMPWRWTITGFKLCSLKTDGTDPKVFDGVLIGKLPAMVRLANDVHGLDGFKKRLDRYVDDITGTWSDLRPLRLDPNELAEVVVARPNLQGLLSSLATWPAPMAHMVDAPGRVQGVNMAHLVAVDWARIPKKPDPTNPTNVIIDTDYLIVAAPVFDTFIPDDRNPPSKDGVAFKWEYAEAPPAADVLRVGYCGAAQLTPPDPAKVQYDPTTYFVAKSPHGLSDTLGANPVADLPLRIAERFDLGALIVEHMNKRVRDAGASLRAAPSVADWKTAREAVMAVSRDMAGVGLHSLDWSQRRPNEGRFRESLLNRLLDIKGEPAEPRTAFISVVFEWQSALSPIDWERLALATAPGIADAAAFEALGSNPAQTENERNQARLDALAHIDAALRDNDVLQRLLPAQLREAIRWAGVQQKPAYEAARGFWERIEHKLTSEILPTYNLSQALALDHIRPFLHDILPTRDDLYAGGHPEKFRVALRRKFKSAFELYANGRLGHPDPNWKPESPAFPGTEPAAYADQISKQLLLDAEAPEQASPTAADDTLYGPGTPTPRPHALTISVAPLNTPDEPHNSADNLSTEIAGYGVLIRRSTKNEKGDDTIIDPKWQKWRLPIMATVRLDGNPPVYLARSDGKRLETALPIALGYGALREGFLTYDEQSLAARHVGQRKSLLEEAEADNVPVVDFIYPGSEPDKTPQLALDGLGKDWRELPELAFGAYYQLAPFVFGQGCVLPRLLAEEPDLDDPDTAAPHVLKMHDAFVLTKENPPAESIRLSRYMRRVPVGGLRTLKPGANLKQAQDASAQVATIAGALPASGRLVRIGDGRFFHAAEGGTLDIFNSTSWSLRFGGLRASHTAGIALNASWAWDDPAVGSAAIVQAERVGTGLKVSVDTFSKTFADVFPAGAEGWFWLQLDKTRSQSGQWSINVQCGALGMAAPAWPIEFTAPTGPGQGKSVWLEVSGLNGDLLFHPAATVGGFAPAASAKTESAVLLMSNDTAKFSLPASLEVGIRPPAVGHDTFARWHRMDQFLNPGEKETWGKIIDYAPAALTKLTGKFGKEAGDLAALEDPAVTHIVAEVIPVRQAAVDNPAKQVALREVRAIALDVPSRDGNEAPADDHDKAKLLEILKTWAHSRTTVTAGCEVVAVPPVSRLAIDGTKFVIKIAPGEVWDIRLYPACPREAFEVSPLGGDKARFHPHLGEPRIEVSATGVATPLVLFSPLEYRLEAARSELPEPLFLAGGAGDDLWSALNVAARGDLIRAKFVRPTTSKFAPPLWQSWDNVGKADLGYQAFVWSGRPLDAYPFAKADGEINKFPEGDQAAGDNIMLWEAAAFENQEGRAPLTEVRTVPPGANSVVLFETDLAAERNGAGAQHYRFRLDVEHRYAALATNHEKRQQLTAAATHTNGIMMERWKRLFVPARPRGTLPPPAVTFAVPLTEPLEYPRALGATDSKAPGLIAYLDEPWAAIGGLSEILDVQIAPAFEPADTVPPPPEPPHVPPRRHVDKDRQWPEYGPDPIIMSGGFNGKDAFVPLSISNLIGQTFDTGTATPGIHGASALMPAPDIPRPAIGPAFDPAWSMAKLRFRRLLHPRGVAEQRETGTETTLLDRNLVLEISGPRDLAKTGPVAITLANAGAKALVALTATRLTDNSGIRLTRPHPLSDDEKSSARISPVSIESGQNLYICLRRAGLRSGQAGGNRDDEGFEITLYADGEKGVWRPVGLGMFPIKLGAELTVTAKLLADGAPVPLEWSRAALHVSDWTPAYWSQYLGAITDATDSLNAKNVADLQLHLVGDKKLQIKAAGAAIQLKPRWTDTLPLGVWQDHSGLYYRVLVTKSVYDASGTLGGEAVVGLYEGGSTAPGELEMIWPKQAAAAPNLSQLHADRRLRARIMLWQEAPAALSEKYLRDDPWEMIFPKQHTEGNQARQDGGRREARARILQISPPIHGGLPS